MGQEQALEHKQNKPLGFKLTLDPGHPYLTERGVRPELATTFGLGYCSAAPWTGASRSRSRIADGKTVAYAGRWAGPSMSFPPARSTYELPLGFHKRLELFNLHRVKQCKHLVVVEGYFGTIRLHGERIPAVGLMGSSISAEQVALLKEHCPELWYLTVMLDGDEPGREAADVVVTKLAQNWWARVVQLPEGEQPDTTSVNTLNALLRRAEPQAT